MSNDNTYKLIQQMSLIIGAICTGWVGDILLNILGINSSWTAVILAALGIGIMTIVGESYANKARSRPSEPSAISEGNSFLISQGALLSVIPIMSALCGNKTSLGQISAIFLGLLPITIGFYHAEKISQMINHLIHEGYSYLERLSLLSNKIRSVWLYQHFREQLITYGIPDEALALWADHLLMEWASKRNMIIYHSEHGSVVERSHHP